MLYRLYSLHLNNSINGSLEKQVEEGVTAASSQRQRAGKTVKHLQIRRFPKFFLLEEEPWLGYKWEKLSLCTQFHQEEKLSRQFNGLTLPPKPTTSMSHTRVFSPSRKGCNPQAGYLLCRLAPSRSLGRRSCRCGDCSGISRHTGTAGSSRGHTCLACILQGQKGLGEGLGEGEHSW